MRFRAAVGCEEAERRLAPRFKGPLAWLRHKGGQERATPHLEMVWLPYYLVVATLEGEGSEPPRVGCLVDALGGEVHRVDLARQRLEEDDEAPLPSRLSAEDARRLGGRFLRSLTTGGSALRSPRALSGVRSRPVSYPYWVYYWERRRGRVDFRVLDAVNGARAGAAVRRSLLRLFADGGSASS